MNDIENDELVIDFSKIMRILWYRKFWIFLCFILIISSTILFTVLSPKKYETGAKLLINKASSTNLADINPFIVSDMVNSAGGLSSLMGGNSQINNEIEILKSPLVLEPVIKANNIRYLKGRKKGELVTVEDLIKSKNLAIENPKGSNVIKISYKSKKSEQAYNVVLSIIRNYQAIYENMNLKKASQDRELLEKSYLQTQSALNSKIARLKGFKATEGASNGSGFNFPSILGFYDKRINKNINSTAENQVETKKLEAEIDQETEKLKMLKSKYEWSSLVENISKNATNIIVLENPEIKPSFDYSEPKLIINIVIALVMSIIMSAAAVMAIEKTDDKITFSDMDLQDLLFNGNKIGMTAVLPKIINNNLQQIALVSMAGKTETERFAGLLKKQISNRPVQIKISHISDMIDNCMENIISSDYVLLLSKIGYTEREIYKDINSLCKELKKETTRFFATVKTGNIDLNMTDVQEVSA